MKKHLQNSQFIILLSVLCGPAFLIGCEDSNTRTEASRPEWLNFRKENSGIAGNVILSLAVDDSDYILIGHSGNGLSRFDGATWKSFLPQKTVTHVAHADADNIWVLADGFPYHLNGVDLTPVNSPGLTWDPTLWYRGLTAEASGNAYIAYTDPHTYQHRVVRVDHDDVRLFTIPDWADGLYAEADTFWISFYSGVMRYDPVHAFGIDFAGIGSSSVLYRDSHRTFWIGGYYGLYRVDGQIETHISQAFIQASQVSAITGDVDQVWVGGAGGFAQWNGTSWAAFPHDSTSVNSDVRALALDKKGNLWIGTFGGGLYEYHAGGIIP